MAKTSINYLFPPQEIRELPTWRFVLHFIAPDVAANEAVSSARAALSELQFKALAIAVPIGSLVLDPQNHSLGVPVEVSSERRKQPGSLEDYESDVWKIYGTLIGLGFGDLYYQAIDWRQ